MGNISFKKYEKTIKEYAEMIEELLDEWAWDSDDALYKKALMALTYLKKELYPDKLEYISIEEILANKDANTKNQLDDFLASLLIRYPIQFCTHRIEWYQNENLLGSNSRYTEVFEDPRLPHYYIFHVDLFQDFKLIHKSTGTLIGFRWHDLCPSSEENIINGRHLNGKLADYDFCSTYIDITNTDLETQAKAIINKDKSIYEELIIPTGTNVEYHYSPCKNKTDFEFNQKIISMVKSNYCCGLKLSDYDGSKTGVEDNISDNLPF